MKQWTKANELGNWKQNNCNNQECKLVIESKEFLKILLKFSRNKFEWNLWWSDWKCFMSFSSLHCGILSVTTAKRVEIPLVFLLSIKIIKILVVSAVVCCFLCSHSQSLFRESLHLFLIGCCWVHVCSLSLGQLHAWRLTNWFHIAVLMAWPDHHN